MTPPPEPPRGRRTPAGDARTRRTRSAAAGPARATTDRKAGDVATGSGKPATGKPATGKPATGRARTTGRAATGRAAGTLDVAERGPGGRWPVPERSVLATVLGVSPLVAVGVAAGLTLLGVVADLLRIGTLGTVFTICYVGGCVLAVVWVRRRSLFGPMVQPPLLLAVAVPVVVLLAGSPRPGTGISERLLTIGAPLVNSFPTMAWTTGAVVALGVGRLLAQRGTDEPVSEPPARGAARGAGRRSRSPRRS